MGLSFLTPNRTILMVSDEALHIYALNARAVRMVEAVPWDSENFVNDVAKILSKDCKGRPALIVYDMVEQHYRKEKVVKKGVSVMDKSTMLKRRLQVAFPHLPVRAALPLKEKLPSDTGKRAAADIYIFAAVPRTDAFQATMDAVSKSLVSVVGFCLLPVEASDMVKTLSARLGKKGRKKSVWSVFIGQHKSGSLRQVITKNGELALTRMSPVTENADAHIWAEDVYQEFNATMSYLTRFGYETRDGLDVTIVADPESGQILRDRIEEPCELNILGAQDAAKTLGLAIGYQENQRYADPVHVAWIGKKSRFILPMKAVEIDNVSRPRQLAALGTVLLLAGGAFLGYQGYSQIETLTQLHEDIADTRTRRSQLNAQYQRELERKKALGFDVQLVQSSIAVFDALEKDRVPALDLFKQIGVALGRDLRVDSVDISAASPSLLSRLLPNAKGDDEKYQLRLNMTYPGTTDIDQGNQEVRVLRERLAELLPGYKVEVTKLLKDYEYTEGLIVETGDLEQNNLQQDFVAEIVIIGPVVKEDPESEDS